MSHAQGQTLDVASLDREPLRGWPSVRSGHARGLSLGVSRGGGSVRAEQVPRRRAGAAPAQPSLNALKALRLVAAMAPMRLHRVGQK